MRLKFKLLYIHLLLIIFSIAFFAFFSKILLSVTLLFSIILLNLNICSMLICFKAFNITLVDLNKYFIFISLLFAPLVFNKEYCFRLIMKIPFNINIFIEMLGFIYTIIIKPFIFLFDIICKLGLIDFLVLIVPCFLIFLYFISKEIIQ